MIAKGIKGSIVNTSSLLAMFGGKTVPAYAASKGGLTQVTRTMCNDWANTESGPTPSAPAGSGRN